MEAELREERANHNATREELEARTKQLEKLNIQLDSLQSESETKLEATENRFNAEIDELKQVSGLRMQVVVFLKSVLSDYISNTEWIFCLCFTAFGSS